MGNKTINSSETYAYNYCSVAGNDENNNILHFIGYGILVLCDRVRCLAMATLNCHWTYKLCILLVNYSKLVKSTFLFT